MVKSKIIFILILFSFIGYGSELSYSSPDIFPLHDDMNDAYQFWIKIFTQYSTNEYVIHDSRNLNVIYEVVTWGELDESKMDEPQTREQKRFFKEKVKSYKKILTDLAALHPDTIKMNQDQRRVHRLLTGYTNKNDFYNAMNRIRIQKGQRNRFKQGLQISGRYMPFLQKIFNKYDLPVELTLLPHVESSFNYKAYSSAGAAGIWQFTRGTGKRYLKISYEIDERLDPILATEAAAKLLKQNYKELGSWPLAITAYNHGLQGMKRAVKKVKTQELNTIIKNYRSRYFKFASRNFYCEFVAVVHVVQNYESYFKSVAFESPIQFSEFPLPQYMKYVSLEKYLTIDESTFRRYNPALRHPIYNNAKYIPKGYRLRVPAHLSVDSLIASIPQKEYYAKQKRSKYYQVRYGDTLSDIARRFGTSVDLLLAMNNISNEHFIRRGMTIRIPDEKEDSIILANRENKQMISDKPTIVQPATTQLVEKGMDSGTKQEIESLQKDQEEETSALATTFQNGKNMDDLDIKFIQTKNPPIGYIRVEPEETLGHYADWLQIKTQRIRDWNKLSYGRSIDLNQRIKLVFDQVTPDEFNRIRLEYHRGIEEDFFMNYEIIGTVTHQVRSGENLWYISHYVYNLPYWLIVAYNKDVDFNQLKVSDQLIIPEIKIRADVNI